MRTKAIATLMISGTLLACEAAPPAPNSSAAVSGDSRAIAIQWEGYPRLIAGTLDLRQAGSSGQIHTLLPDNQGSCDGTFNNGAWAITCSNGMTASGTYTAAGPGRGSTGEGVDSQGRKVVFTLGAAPGARPQTTSAKPAPLPTAPADATASTAVTAMSRVPGSHPPGASMGKVEFNAPAKGTAFQLSNGRNIQIIAAEGKSVRVNNGFLYGGFLMESGSQAGRQDFRDSIESLWPLEVGKKIAFTISGRSGDGFYSSWRETITVVREEDIKTAAGTFRTFVIECRQTGQANNISEGLTTYWYAPEIGFPARVKEEVIRGLGKPADATLVRIVPPASSH